VLAKGPVVLLFTLLPWLLAPLWHDGVQKKKFYTGLLIMILVALAPVSVWLYEVAQGTDKEFFHWLVVEQTKGRMTGSFGGAHSRPFYFYLPFFLGLFVPWIVFPAFWRKLKLARRADPVIRFCFFTIVPTLAVFMIMSGKQAHYLIPLLPFVAILTAHGLESVQMKTLKRVAVAAVSLMVIGQGIASFTVFPRHDISKIAEIVAAHPDTDWAYVRNYHGEVGFLAKREKPVEGLHDLSLLHDWFIRHPDGMAVVRYRTEDDIRPYKALYTMDYSSAKKLSVIVLNPEYP
jgi:4-amino-4-deoxy-L-arabinose transferase-like glycosyltransferase